MCTDNTINSWNINIEYKKYLDDINRLCIVLDFFASPHFEEEMIFSLKCYAKGTTVYINNNLPEYIDFDDFELYELREMLFDVYYYDDEKGFSKEQRWLDFVDCVNRVNVLLKDEIKRSTAEIKALGLVVECSTVNSENIHTMLQCNVINSLCDELDRLVSPNIEKEVTCELHCYVLTDAVRFIDCLTKPCDEVQSLLGDTELTLLPQLRKALCDVSRHHYYEEEQGYEANGYVKGFFKTQRWLDFVAFVNTVNILLKDAVKRHKEITESIT